MALQHRLERLLSRTPEPRQVRSLVDPPIVMATELGKRAENQDRVAVIRIPSASRPNASVMAVAVSDGMGGMEDGGACASLAVATFFEALLRLGALSMPDRILKATLRANECVHAFSRGRGGATLSAVVLEAHQPSWLVNVGDSRIYGDLMLADGKRKLDRLTVDDSLAEAFGAEGRELLQFIGMGEGMRPHVRMMPPEARTLLLTTDGIHFLDQNLFAEIFLQADTLKQAVDRLAALARWFGGSDNATIAAFAPNVVPPPSDASDDDLLEIWTPFESIEILSPANTNYSWIRGEQHGRDQHQTQAKPLKSKPRKNRGHKRKSVTESTEEGKPKSEQLKIEIEVGNGASTNADREKI